MRSKYDPILLAELESRFLDPITLTKEVEPEELVNLASTLADQRRYKQEQEEFEKLKLSAENIEDVETRMREYDESVSAEKSAQLEEAKHVSAQRDAFRLSLLASVSEVARDRGLDKCAEAAQAAMTDKSIVKVSGDADRKAITEETEKLRKEQAITDSAKEVNKFAQESTRDVNKFDQAHKRNRHSF